ncbi:MAG: cupin domain-containing protein [Ruminococcaceae bacterium]|nr:cupin domain-containing protein [Oscillospiraceae bacterium]
MIKNFDDFKTELRENMRGGDGTVTVTSFVTAEELNDKGRLFGKITLKPGCGIGFHVHEKDSELFYILKGTAVYDDNGTKTTVTAGNVTLTPAGTGHAIKNESDEDVELIALIVYA